MEEASPNYVGCQSHVPRRFDPSLRLLWWLREQNARNEAETVATRSMQSGKKRSREATAAERDRGKEPRGEPVISR